MLDLIVPYHKDAARINERLTRFESRLRSLGVESVLLCHNGTSSVPLREEDLPELAIPLRLLHTDLPGIGAGYRVGILQSQADYLVLSASDLPFGTSDIEAWADVEKATGAAPEVAVGSKLHPRTQTKGLPITRRISTLGFTVLRDLIIQIPLPKDTQGTIIVRRDLAQAVIENVCHDSFFFSTEFLSRCWQQSGKKAIELPVTYILENRDSSVELFRDSYRMLRSLFELRSKLNG